ncbi:MAG: Rpn family recombination-promoting nuclease/putative transposase [Treponema sp.]|nr:Rpn family recombination-promoting nuclease/putative transposase [Treponema sp.]
MNNLLKMQQRLNPLNDYLFLKVMGEKGDEVQLLGFLNAVLGKTRADHFTSVEIIENRSFTPKVIGDKASILDVRAVLQGKTRVNIEVQIRNHYNMERRSLFYWSKEYSESMGAGQDYRELPDVIAVNIVDFDYPPVQNFHTQFHLREDHNLDLMLTDALEIHFINMVQYRKQGREGILDNPLCRWLVWFDAGSPPELIAEVVKMDSAIQAANERMVYVTGDKEAIRAYEMRQMALSDYTSTMNYARETGLAEGHAQGRNEERQRLLEMFNLGLPMEEIKRRLKE